MGCRVSHRFRAVTRAGPLGGPAPAGALGAAPLPARAPLRGRRGLEPGALQLQAVVAGAVQ